MSMELNKVELDITKEIINIAFSKAADSLSFFIKEKVIIQLLDLKVDSRNYAPLSKKAGTVKSYLLTTHIRGDVSGKSYLVFNESEVGKLVDANLPESIKSNPIEKANMTDAILLEVDNIITASVVTQFANILQCKLYGDVPHLDILDHDELNPFLNKNNPELLNVMYISSRFITKNLDTSPEFIWLMDDQFFLSVKNLVSDEQKLELLRKMSSAV